MTAIGWGNRGSVNRRRSAANRWLSQFVRGGFHAADGRQRVASGGCGLIHAFLAFMRPEVLQFACFIPLVSTTRDSKARHLV